MSRAVGIDVGATRVHVAVLDDKVRVVTTADVGEVVALCDGAAAIAVDAPAEAATGRVHPGARSPKFAVARCNEIAAGEQLGVWVPWVTPVLDACPGWMHTGFAVWDALRAAGHDPIEVYPAGSFWLLNDRRWPPKKTTPAGRAARLALLEPHVGPLEVTSHDHVDAVMAAVVARGPSRAVRHTDPGCDASSLFVLESLAAFEVDGSPRRERHVRHSEVIDDATLCAEPGDAGTHDLGSAGERRVLRHADEQRARIDVAVADNGLDLELRPARLRRIDDVGVVHDPLEHRHPADDQRDVPSATEAVTSARCRARP